MKLKTQGYASTSFLTINEIEPLRDNLSAILNNTNGISSDLFYTSGRDEEAIRKIGKELSWKYIDPHLNRVINTNAADIEGCAWLIKPPSGNASILNAHQDSALIDETEYASFYGWIPLQDVNIENGTIFVLPGSHLWNIPYRSLDVPWELEKFTGIIEKYCVPIVAKAGDIVLFEGATIHGSYPNVSNDIRAALNIFVKPKKADYLHFMQDEKTPRNMVESYKINLDFFYSYNYRKRPDTNIFPFYKMFKNKKFNFSPEKVEFYCKETLRLLNK